MPQLDATHVQINNCIVVWDAITKPEINDGGNQRWGLKVVVDPNNPDLALAHQLANNELQNSEFKGTLPNGGIMPVGTAGPNEFNGMFTGWAVINASTFRMPNVHEESGAIMQPMQYGNLLYAGQVVDIIVNASAYNNKSKGVALRLDGFMIKASQNAERLAFGGGGYDTSQAFGGGTQGQPAQGQPAQGQPAQGQPAQGQPAQGQPQQGGYQPAQGQPQQGGYQPQQGGYQPQQGGYQPAQGQPAQGQPQQGGYQPAQGQPTQGGYQPAQGQPAQGQPQQATNFLPGQQ